MVKVPNGIFDIIVNFYQKIHRDKLSVFFSRFEGTRGEKNKYSAP